MNRNVVGLDIAKQVFHLFMMLGACPITSPHEQADLKALGKF
jgi:hypothetical protein